LAVDPPLSPPPPPPPWFQDLREAFRIFDKDHSGYIEAKEIIAVTTTLGQALSRDELEQFMSEADLDGDGRLNYEEFVKIMTKDMDD
jgi:calmodulin